jgi:hypothetical protein
MISKNDKIEPGIIKLQSKAKPPLTAGEYVLKSKITVKDGSSDSKVDTEFENNSLLFHVSAPRFNLEPGLVNSVYPLASSVGSYHTSLPHIIFTRKTLPWERTIKGTDQEPWMTLLLLSAKEIQDNKVIETTMKANQLIEKGRNEKLIAPLITLETWEKDEEVNVLELPAKLFENICALKDELPFLAHTRQIDMSLKESGSTNNKGWFSVIVGNRLPQKGMDNSVYLVSLEGHDLSKAAENDTTMRLVVLHKWKFLEQGSTFGELCDQLLNNIGPFRIEKKATNKHVSKALDIGYMPINHQWRNGKKSVCWYRGPLVPVDIPSPEKYQYKNADQALRFDGDTGMFDISYSLAWQLGRMLGIQNQAFSKALSTWKSEYKLERPLIAARQILEKEKQIDLDELSAIVHNVVSDEVMTDFILECWKED